MQAHRPGVFRLAYLLLGDGDDAEDVTQETFIRAHHAIARFDRSREMRPWLLRIATNLARNKRRSVARFLAALQRLVFAEPTLTHVPSTESTASDNLRAQLLWQAVRRLPHNDQEIIYLRHFLEVSESEASDVLGVALGTVKSRAHRALQKLKGVIEKDFPELKE
ncbi:MAG: RNA polymerase sigma factor [Anaerolineae bacterium]|nr:RNA polymerase sigma factor [Anaerolineae bacterium]